MRETKAWGYGIALAAAALFGLGLLFITARGPAFAPLAGFWGGPGWDAFWNGFVHIALIAAVVFAVAIAVKTLFASRTSDRAAPSRDADSGADAMEIVRQRYARGEITREEYLQLLDDLKRK